MASPPYQDWQKYIVPSADVIVSENNGPLNIHTGPIVDCSAWSHILVTLHNIDTLAHMRCDLTWRGYNASLLAQNVNYFVAGPGDFVQMVIPCKGRQVGMEYLFLDNPPTSGLAYALLGMNHPMSKYDAAIFNTSLVSQNINLAANATQLVTMQYWYEGPVTVTISSHLGGPATAALQQFDALAGAWTEYARFQVLNDSMTIPLEIGFTASPVRFNVMNGGTAQTIQVNAVPRPSW
jgi:hypothetical protein